jgi:hypothetical protein
VRKSQLRQPVQVENAMGKYAPALLAALDTACTKSVWPILPSSVTCVMLIRRLGIGW